MKPRIAVIGAGWAGLAAAVELTAAGRAVTLFEAGRVPGGRARRVDIDGRALDNGQHILLGAYRDTLALMEQIGADPADRLERRPLTVVDNAGFRLALPRLPAPLNLAWGLLTAHGPSLPEKLATARWMERLKAAAFRLPQDLTVAHWLDAAGQTGRLRRHLWEPLCLAALNTPAERASAQVFANVLRDSLGSPRRADTDLLLPRSDLGDLLPAPASAWLTARGAELRYGHRVRLLECRSDGIRLDGEDFAAALVAVAPHHAGSLHPALAVSFAAEPIATAYLQYSPETRLPQPLHALSGGLGQWVVDRGNGLLAGIQSGHGPWEALSDKELCQALGRELNLPGKPAWSRVVREKRATLSCRPGLVRPGPATGLPRLWRAGDYAWADYPSTLEGAVRSGRAAARACLDHLP